MADVSIIHAADKGTAATRLADAIVAAGFSVGAVEVEDPAALAELLEGSTAEARILIWSRALVSHALHSGELFRIRQLPGLIEVSADGITPPSRSDEARVVSISGWRGQAFHPGWQRIHVELKRLCGARKALPEAAPRPAVAKDPPPRRTATAAPAGAARPKARRLMLGGGIAALLVAATVGAAVWLGDGAPEAPPRRALSEAPGPEAVAEAARAPLPAEPEPSQASAAQPPISGSTAPPPPAAEPPAAQAKAKAKAEASRAAPSKAAARPTPGPSPQGPVKKYSRKNSKVMRQYCERSGRGTPQCRTFLRSVRERDGDGPD